MESLGLLITLTLGGLGMFLVVLVVTFVLAKVPKLSQLLTRSLEQDRDWFLWSIGYKHIRKQDKFRVKDRHELWHVIPIFFSGCDQAPGVWEIQWVWWVLPGGVRQRLHGAHDVLQQWEEGHLCHWGEIFRGGFAASSDKICFRTWRAAS